MNLFEIDREMADCRVPVVDQETGEITGWNIDTERIAALEMERERKIRNTACWIKNLRSDAAQLKEQKNKFAAREKATNNMADSLEEYLKAYLNGEKVKAPEFAISWRNTASSDVTDLAALPEKYLVPQEPKVDKKALLADLKAGEDIPGAALVYKNSMSIK